MHPMLLLPLVPIRSEVINHVRLVVRFFVIIALDRAVIVIVRGRVAGLITITFYYASLLLCL